MRERLAAAEPQLRYNPRTPGRFRTRAITDGVVPSLHVDYKRSRIKQYHTQALLTAIVGFALQPHGFTRAQLAACVDTLSGTTASPGRMTYDSRSET